MRLNKTEHAPVDRIQQGGRGDTPREANCYYTAFWPRSFMAIPRSDFKE